MLARTLLLFLVASAGSAAAGPMTVTDAWIRATPPGVPTAAAYLTITNAGAADRLLGAATPAAQAVELHAHVEDGGLHRMERLAEVAVPAGAVVRLEPAGLHLMLVDIAAPLAAGMRVPLTLRFATVGEIELEIPVVDARTSSAAVHAEP